ncbi:MULTISPECIES: hypothetical protein [unclassified Pseudonocardia]|nr:MULTISPECIES: hypothetical protein [unclassified Pseudonocardia]
MIRPSPGPSNVHTTGPFSPGCSGVDGPSSCPAARTVATDDVFVGGDT